MVKPKTKGQKKYTQFVLEKLNIYMALVSGMHMEGT